MSKILIIEDDTDLREGLLFSFTADGDEAAGAGTKRDGLREIVQGSYDLVLLILSVGYGIREKRKTYQKIDRLLDCVLNGEPILQSDVEEGGFSALVSRVLQIQNVLGQQKDRAEEEKEQVKSLVSNMSQKMLQSIRKEEEEWRYLSGLMSCIQRSASLITASGSGRRRSQKYSNGFIAERTRRMWKDPGSDCICRI